MNRDNLKQQGYSQEDAYFDRHNRELIEKRRRELDAQRSQKADRSQIMNWMKCPKCGEKMEEIDLRGIKVDQCNECRGMYFDAGELQTLMELQEPKGFFGLIRQKLL